MARERPGQSFRIRPSEPGVGAELTVVRGIRPRWSYFLRTDTMHQLYTYLEQDPGKSANPFHELRAGPSGKTSAWWWRGGSSCTTRNRSSGTCSRRD